MVSDGLLIRLLSGLGIRLLVILLRVLRLVLLLVGLVALILARAVGVLRHHILVFAIVDAAPFHVGKEDAHENAHDKEELEDGLDAGKVGKVEIHGVSYFLEYNMNRSRLPHTYHTNDYLNVASLKWWYSGVIIENAINPKQIKSLGDFNSAFILTK